jgi:hypothetical protein
MNFLRGRRSSVGRNIPPTDVNVKPATCGRGAPVAGIRVADAGDAGDAGGAALVDVYVNLD